MTDLGANRPQHEVEASFVMEVVLTGLLIAQRPQRARNRRGDGKDEK